MFSAGDPAHRHVGIIPILDDNTCRWAAINVDEYAELNHAHLAQRVLDLGLPLLVCRSKSGGTHLYSFATEPVAAKIFRSWLKQAARLIGVDRKGLEIFPKQDELHGDDFGNWINMPIFGLEMGLRYVIKPDNNAMAAEELFTYAEALRCDPKYFETTPEPEQSAQNNEPAETSGEGGRNNQLTKMAGKLRRMGLTQPEIEAALLQASQQRCSPPLEESEVRRIAKSVARYEAAPEDKAKSFELRPEPASEFMKMELSRSSGSWMMFCLRSA